MSFSEKLLQLRKEKGYSQEMLAEKLGTTRQAVSKWENGQGFPETEKLLMIGNLFEVSIDYMLKENELKSGAKEHGYYVSQEMAEGYLSHQQKSSNRIATGVCLLIMAFLPYLMLRHEPVVYSVLIILLAAGGVVVLVSAILKDEERYHVLGKEALMLDQGYMKQLKERLNQLKSRYTLVIIVGAGMLAVGAIAFLLEEKGISEGALVPYYPVCVVLIAMGTYIIIRTSTLWSSYSLLIYNEKYINRRNDGFWRKIKRKLAE
ncbi:helix-turn-helix domain-containing protein [Paenibacillus luteus]|uniref:helix-turn-helix domain-containing protein n=1 Tax=Paenibacillus luteus TaxID=2545753 RepID=UPI00114278E5|nr:helix-turn-helix transcriptional regulator [Paenibacillus luteus]